MTLFTALAWKDDHKTEKHKTALSKPSVVSIKNNEKWLKWKRGEARQCNKDQCTALLEEKGIWQQSQFLEHLEQTLRAIWEEDREYFQGWSFHAGDKLE